jgi:hypothetical protein
LICSLKKLLTETAAATMIAGAVFLAAGCTERQQERPEIPPAEGAGNAVTIRANAHGDAETPESVRDASSVDSVTTLTESRPTPGSLNQPD